MKMKFRPICLALTAVMLFSPLSGCGKGDTKPADAAGATQKGGPDYLNATGFPIVKNPITLKAMVSKQPTQPDFKEILAFQEYEKMTGIKIEWDNIPSANISEKRNLALASNDLPDIFYRTSLPEKDVLKYGEQGVFIKLNDLINKYAPNYKKIMDTMPDVKKSIPAYDGSIYVMAGLSDNEAVETNPKMYFNKKWLDKANLKLPTTTDELYTVLSEMKKVDYNGNGKTDEIPWSAAGISYIQNSLLGAWGLKDRGNAHANVDMDEKTGKLRFIPTNPYYKEMLEYINKLYKEGLIDQEIFTMKSAQITAKGEQNLLGATSFTNTTQIGSTHEKDYVGLTEALKGPHGDKLWASKRGHIASKGSFTITNVNKYPEASMRWIDYFYGDAGAKLIYMGVEGVSFEKTADGKYKFKDEIISNIPKGSNFDQVVSKYTPYAGGGLPALAMDKYFQGGEMQPVPLKASQDMQKYVPKEIWGPFSYSGEENDKLLSLENDILSYVTQSTAEFIIGKKPMSEWDNYVAQCKKMGLDDYLKIYTAAYERYKKN